MEPFWGKFLYDIKIKLVLIQNRLFKAKMLILIPRTTTMKIPLKILQNKQGD
jgi:hypothetical protein